MDLNERKSLEKIMNSNSLTVKGSNSEDNPNHLYKFLKNIVVDLFNNDNKQTIKKFLSQEFSLNRYNKEDLVDLINGLQKIIDADDENLRYFSIFLLHTDKDIRNTALNALKYIIKRGVSFSATIFEIILSSLLVDVKQETTENFAIFLAKNANTRLIEYLVENLYYEIYLKKEFLRKEKDRVKNLMTDDKDQYLKEWETFARYRLMSGEKITNLVASADCGEYQDALLEGKGLISFPTCIKALSEYGTNLYLPSLSGLIHHADNKFHKNWLMFLSIVQGNEQYFPELVNEIEKNSDSSSGKYILESLKSKLNQQIN
ncbi:MAG: hypothetical protein HeimC3_52620 [Candidatus Heimdallarchaeota archaeon LC_3]|nr:MAG: hypothetical protein HeimC3_52620 [Candidatus Heimdallarchaeota archaeon LC_3]